MSITVAGSSLIASAFFSASAASAADPRSAPATAGTATKTTSTATDKTAATGTAGLPISPVRPIPAGDEIVTGRGDGDGWHLYAASAAGDWAWKPLATLLPGGGDGTGERWIGRQCLTGDGRWVVAVVAPWSAVNTPAGVERGGLAYAVDAHTGAVRPLVGGVSLHYFTPSCGVGSDAALTRYVGDEEQTTQLVAVDAATGSVGATRTMSGQLTGAIPAPGGGFLAVRGDAVVRIGASAGVAETVLTHTGGVPFDLVADAGGGADFLVGTDQKAATLWQLGAHGAKPVGTGTFADLALFPGRAGHPVASGVTKVDPAAGIRTVSGSGIEAASLDGGADSPSAAAPPAAGKAATRSTAATLQRSPVLLKPAKAGAPTTSWFPDVAAPPTMSFPRILHDDGTLTGYAAASALQATRTAQATHAAAATQSPPYDSLCAVARNDVTLQAMQPNAAMVDWAANLAGRSLLSGAHARPAGFDNLGLPGYQPSTDFPMPALLGPGGKAIPREVLDAIFAQESNFKQASWHSIQGLAGNPLIADYYAAGGGYQVGVVTDATGAVSPDCGYGLGQVTTGMRRGQSDSLPYDLQRKVAVDYAENAAAAASILGGKWNELINAGITPNDSNSDILENWYLAVWDYNSGLHPSTSSPWGLGWLNNPANPAYPYNRHPFLHQDLTPVAWQVTYDDASHPADWPYQEKIFGWMEVPIIDSLSGLYSYPGTLETTAGGINVQQANPFELARPGRMDFCDPGKNQCDPSVCDKATYPNCDPSATQGQGPCTRTDSKCWWHYPASWCNPVTNICHTGSWDVDPTAPEPSPTGATNWFPPMCDVDNASGGAVPPGSVVVDTQTHALNLEGCVPAAENWRNSGTFAFTYGDPDNPAAQATDMDLHQLGTGLGGHMWFTHTNEPTDANGLSYWGLTGTWTPQLPALGDYTIKVLIPATGATSTQAEYTVNNGYGHVQSVPVNQNAYTNAWVTLGTFWLGPGANVSLTNLNTTASGDLAFTGMAFVPASGPAPYAILGDSYSAGEGTGGYDYGTDTSSNDCHRSPHAFGRVYANGSSAYSGGDFEHLACSGATMDNLTTTGQNNEPAQISELLPNANLVTVTIGGNDAGFGSVLTRCVTPGLSCESYYNQNDANNEDVLIDSLRPKLAATYTAIHTKAPGARIVALTYPSIFKPGTTCPDIGGLFGNMRVADVEWLIGESDHLDDVIVAAAGDAGIQVLDERYAFYGHELCTGSSNSWVFSLPIPWQSGSRVTDKSGWFHPTAAGQNQMATDLAAFLSTSKTARPAVGDRGSIPAAAAAGWMPKNLPAGIPNGPLARTMLGRLPLVTTAPTVAYKRSFFGSGWRTMGGCDTRQDILRRDALKPRQSPPVALAPAGSGCPITAGSWESPYEAAYTLNTYTPTSTPTLTDATGGMQIDHIVTLKNGWNTGASTWTTAYGTTAGTQMLIDFANDEYRPQLLSVTSWINNQKSDQSPDTWVPPNVGFVCTYDEMWVAVKEQWSLGVTTAEQAALTRQLSACV